MVRLFAFSIVAFIVAVRMAGTPLAVVAAGAGIVCAIIAFDELLDVATVRFTGRPSRRGQR